MKGDPLMDNAKQLAAARLGIPVHELVDVLDSPAGTVYVTADGQSYVDVVEPDGAGATGLMFLAAPTERYADTFPVYTAPEPDEDDGDDVSTADPVDPEGQRDAGVVDPTTVELEALQVIARDLGIAFRKNTSVKRLRELIAAASPAPTVPTGSPVVVGDQSPELVTVPAGTTVVPIVTVEQSDEAAADDLSARAGALGIDPELYDADELAEVVAAAEAAAADDDENDDDPEGGDPA